MSLDDKPGRNFFRRHRRWSAYHGVRQSAEKWPRRSWMATTTTTAGCSRSEVDRPRTRASSPGDTCGCAERNVLRSRRASHTPGTSGRSDAPTPRTAARHHLIHYSIYSMKRFHASVLWCCLLGAGTGTQRSLGGPFPKTDLAKTLYIFILTNLHVFFQIFFYSICFYITLKHFYVLNMRHFVIIIINLFISLLSVFPLLLKINPRGPI